MSTTYRAAYYAAPQSTGVLLTQPEHASLSDTDLIAEAMAEAERAGLLGAECPADAFRACIVIGDWTE